MDNTKLKSRLATKAQALQEAPAESEQDSLVPAQSGYAALNGNTLDLIRENLKEQPLTYQMFDMVKSPSGGSTVFTVPGLAGDEAEKELTGIILDYTTPRAYWDTPDPVEGTPPTCLSHNSLVSEDGKACAHCPFNDYGSKDGETGAKACKESVLLFLLRPGNVLPLLVRVPVKRHCFPARSSRGGKPYALFHFEAVSALDPEEAASAKAFAKQFMESVSTTQQASELTKAG